MSAPSAPAAARAQPAATAAPRVTIADRAQKNGPNGAGTAPRRPSAATPFHPPPDTGTYRDLLLFEERLKMNAHMLRRRRRRYRVFLYSFITAFCLMAYRLFVLPPENIVLLRGLQAVTVVVFITLALFFASGMYEEKIRYAHSYINHSNKALRPLNMYFNAVSTPTKRPSTGRRVSNSQNHPGHTVMAQIPPSSNPRGELIFSSRVDHHFEDGYKRYRTAFERRREERSRSEAAAAGPWYVRMFRRSASPSPLAQRRGSSTAASPPGSRRATPEPGAIGVTSATRAASPPRRRRTPPPPGMERENTRERAESYSFVYTGPSEAVGAKARSK